MQHIIDWLQCESLIKKKGIILITQLIAYCKAYVHSQYRLLWLNYLEGLFLCYFWTMDNPKGTPSIESFLSLYKCANRWLEVGCLDGLMGYVFCTPLDLIDILLTPNGMAPGVAWQSSPHWPYVWMLVTWTLSPTHTTSSAFSVANVLRDTLSIDEEPIYFFMFSFT